MEYDGTECSVNEVKKTCSTCTYHGGQGACTYGWRHGYSCWISADKKPARETDDPVNHPPHYTQHPSGIECIQITEHMSFTLGNAVKYIWRADLKNGIEDLKKARWYIEREIARRGAHNG